MALEPPPRIIEKFVNIWRDWLYFLYELVDSHTGGSAPVPPATGTSWNAHGNTATGEAANPLKIDAGSLWIEGSTGDIPATGVGDGTGVRFMYVPSEGGAIRAGRVTGTEWDLIGDYSVAFGLDNEVTTAGGFASGSGNSLTVQAISSIAMGTNNSVTGSTAVAMGASNSATAASSIAMGQQNTSSAANAVTLGSSNSNAVSASVMVGTGNSSVGCPIIIGNNNVNAASGTGAMLVGSNSDISAINGIAIGKFVSCIHKLSAVIGRGVGPGNELATVSSGSLVMGIGSDLPSIIMLGGSVGSPGNIGIIQAAPLSTLDIGGSVGYQQDKLTSTDAVTSGSVDEVYDGPPLTFAIGSPNSTITKTVGTDTDFDVAGFTVGMEMEIFRAASISSAENTYHIAGVTATVLTLEGSVGFNGAGVGVYQFYQSGNQIILSDQLVAIVDPDGADGTPTEPPDTSAYVVHLPDISSNDRRMYHIVNSGVTTNEVRIISDYIAGDNIMDVSNIAGAPIDTLVLDRKNSIQIVANLTDQVWYVI